MSVRETVVQEGYGVKLAHYPDEVGAEDTFLERCDNCKNGMAPRKAGAVDHCHYCGQIIRTNN